MLTEKRYTLYGQARTASEAQEFIQSYTKKARKPDDRSQIIADHVPKGSKVLDFGCGWGVSSTMIWERGNDVTGIDLDPISLSIAKDITGEHPTLRFLEKNITDMESNQFDVVVSNQVIEHTHNPGNHLMECNRVLKEGGLLLAATPNVVNPQFVYYQMSPHPEREFSRISNVTRTDYCKTHDHIHGWDPYSFCRLLCTMGFEYIHHVYMEGVPFPGPRYWNTRIPLIKNLSYTMLFKMKKYRYVQIGPHE